MTIRFPVHVPSALAIAALAANTAWAQPQNQDVLRELAALRAQVEQLRAEMDALKARVPPAPAEGAAPAAPLEILQSQIAELAQVKVESTSRFPVKVFGTVHASMFANSANANWLDNPNLAGAPFTDGTSGTFSGSLRQTRLGFTVDGPSVGSARTSAVLAMDFFGGMPGFQTGQVMGLPRLLVAYARVDGERTALQLGQDHMLFAPRDPTSLAAFSFPLLFRSGNLYLRAPQVRVEQAIGPHLRALAGVMAPVGGDVPDESYRFVPPALGGERSHRPAFQARIVAGTADAAPDAERQASIGVSAHHGWERLGGVLEKSWATAVDFTVRRAWVGVAGEIFTGDNVDAFGGGTGLNARASGGWAELQVMPSARLSFHAGTGLDDLRTSVPLPRRRNRSSYANVIFAVTPELRTSFEYRWLGTEPATGATRTNHHLDWVFAYGF
jgi:hypothetical protein